MKLFRNLFYNRNRYREHGDAVIISCYFNPQNSPYRLSAFNRFYKSIKHMDHCIMECIIGDSTVHLPQSYDIERVKTQTLLWHKEGLLNKAIEKLVNRYKYIFWLDADVIFTNLNWLTDSVKELQKGARVVQPFEYCCHMQKDEISPGFLAGKDDQLGYHRDRKDVWRSFCSNCVDRQSWATSTDYNTHGHVGFAWGATSEVLKKVPLYDRALVGGADHIMAHAAAGQIPHKCIDKSFTDDLETVYKWSKKFYDVVQGRIAYVKGDVYHIWHGDIEKRQYLKRIQEFTPATKTIVDKDSNGLYVAKHGEDKYTQKYFQQREVTCYHPHTPNTIEVHNMPTGMSSQGSAVSSSVNHYYDESYDATGPFS